MMRSLSRAVILIMALVPAAAGAQTIQVQLQSTSTVSYQLQQLLNTYVSPSAPPWETLVPPSYEHAVEKLQSALANTSILENVSQLLATSSASTTNAAAITALLSQVEALQAQIADLVAARGAAPVPEVPGDAACPLIGRALVRGISGDDVAQLQSFLIGQGMLAPGNATGFFGALTEAAVQAWQSTKGIVSEGSPETTGFGAVGPQTRASLAACLS